jgi:rSAM/selenodomain-associated transferase 1
MADNGELFQIFLKAPEPGKVKTRLIPALGEARAAAVHLQLVQHILAVADALEMATECWVAGDMGHPFVQDLSDRYRVNQQQGIDLGERMYNALLHGLEHHNRVVLVGADAYSLTPDIIREAFLQLVHQDVVIGPAHDGGYVLVGVRRLHPALFADIDWGTESVLSEQLENISCCKLSSHLLPAGFDVDTIDDIRSFAPELLNA